MFDEYADMVDTGFGPTGFDLAKIQGLGGLKLHQRSLAEEGLAVKRRLGVGSFEGKQAPLDRQLRVGDRGKGNRYPGGHRGHRGMVTNWILAAPREMFSLSGLLL
jgi:hypothetical protein